MSCTCPYTVWGPTQYCCGTLKDAIEEALWILRNYGAIEHSIYDNDNDRCIWKGGTRDKLLKLAADNGITADEDF